MKLLCTLLYFSIAVATINARHRKEWKRVDPRKSTRELLLPFYHSLSPACNHGAGFFRDPSDCHQYIRCVDEFGNGRRFSVFVGRCEPGLVFDENISACNWPELAAPCSDAPEKVRETFNKFKPKEDEVQLILEDNVISGQSDEQNRPYPVQEQPSEEYQGFGNQFVQEPQFFDVRFFQDQSNHQDSQIPSKIQEPGSEGSFQETSASKESPLKPQEQVFHETPFQKDAVEMSEHENFQESIVQQQQQLTHEQSVFQEPVIQQKEQSAHNQTPFQKPLIQQQEQLPEEQPIFQEPSVQEQELVAQEMPVFTEIAFQDKETDLDFESFQKPAVVQEQTENQREVQVAHQQPASEPEIGQISHQEKQESVGAFQEIVDDETQQVEIQSDEGYKPQQEQSQWWIPDENNSQHPEPEILIEDNKGKPISESVKEKPILCLSEGFFSHPENCSRFIRCVRIDQSAFAIHFFECPHQLVFNEKDSSCIVSDAQNCWKNHRSKRQVRNAPLECKAEGFFRHPADCRSFYRCVKQPTGIYETHSFSCPDTLVFDEEFATCNWPEKAPPCEEIGQSYKTTGRPSYQTPTTATRSSYQPPATATRPSYQPPQTSTRPPYEPPQRSTRPPYEPSQRSTKAPYEPPQRSTRPPYGPPQRSTRPTYEPPQRSTRPPYEPPQRSTRPPYEPPQRSTRPPYEPPQRSTRPTYRPPTTAARSSYQPPQKSTSKTYRSTSKPRNDFNDNLNPLIPVREYTTQRTTLNTKYATQRTTQKPKYTETPVADNYGDQKCKSPGFYPHEKDCNKFYKCIKKRDYFVRYELSCPPNFAYDEATSRCVAERYVSSCSRRRTPYPPKQDDEEISSTESPSSDSTKQTDSDVSCTEEGYFRHPDDCNRFYRCVDYNGDGQEFVRYDFKCPEGLVFDETNSVCNWPDESAPCDGKGEKKDDKDSSSEGEESGDPSTTESTTIKATAATNENPTQEPSTTSSSSTTLEGSSTGGATTEDSGYGGSDSGDNTEEPSENEQSGTCTQEGFFRNPEDCNKFYRCVDFNGDGQEFVRYDFSCPEGLVFDEANSVCNWPDESAPCDATSGDKSGGSGENQGESSTSRSTSQQDTESIPKDESTTSTPSSTTRADEEDSTASSAAVDSTTGRTTPASSSTQSRDESSTSEESSSSGECTEAGFFRNPEDCNKFYRCVDYNGDGQEFVRYDFSCPEGLVFDEVNSVCNWPDESAPCDGTSGDKSGGSSEDQGESSTSGSTSQQGRESTPKDKSTESTSTSTIQSSGEDQGESSTSRSTSQQDRDSTPKDESTTSSYSSTTRSSEDYSTTSSASSSTQSRNQSSTSDEGSSGGECTEAGFYRNPEDCNKFYRCVDYNGDGQEFVRYDFACPEGLVFDEINSVCNWPEQSAPCDTKEGSGITKAEKTTTDSYPTTKSTTEYPSEDRSTESTSFTTDSSTSRTQTTSRSTQPSPTTESTYTTQSSPSTSRSTREPTQSPSSTTESAYTTESSTSDNSATDISTEASESTSRGDSESGGDVECKEEGFFRNPEDCNKFYRCVDFNGDGQQYVRYDFECPEGLYFDEVNSVCNWPEQSPKCETNAGRENTSDSGTSTSQKEDSSSVGTQSTTQQISTSYSEESTTGSYTTTQSSSTYSTTTQSSSTYSSTTQNSECEKPGFYRYPDDCTKFYRCVDETGDGKGLVRYDFKCPDGLIFDDKNKKCDWPHSDPSCDVDSSTSSEKTTQTTKDYTSSPASTTRSSTTAGTTRGTTSSSSSSYEECTEEGFFRNPDDCSKYYRCIDEGDGTFTREDYACAEDEVFDEEMRYCNRKDLAPPCDGSTTEQASSPQSQGTTGGTTAVYPTESSTKGEKSECSKPGFFRCPEDCNKFYRCVDEEGDGQNLVRYDFKCPDGLIFDEKNKKCDWPSSELTCDSDSTTTYSTQTTRTSTSQSSKPQTTKDYTTSTRPPTSETSGTTSDVTSASGECTEEGFFRNPDDCSKYYRCIDTGYGTYTREDYACEEDEVFDEEMRYCNRKDLAPPCDGSTPGQTSSQTKTTTDKTTSVYTTEKQTSTSTTQKATTAYPTESSTGGSKSTTAYPTESSTGGSKSECEEEGFFRCPEDCNKFYRCVEDGGYLVRYDFKCPEGLIFDEKNKKCDWPSSELTCDDSSSATSSSSYPSTAKTTASSENTSSSGECIEEGFFRNPDDCSKYYRCIDEGDGTLTREDFACEEDEVFDEEMRYCNKKDLAPPCEDQSSTTGSSSTSTSESQTTRPSTSPTSESSTSRSTDSITKESSTTEGYESTSGTSKKDTESGDCEEEGFHRHPDDCSKFYRCVDFKGDGQSFTRYDFDCPEGLVFDEDNDVCNWPSAVPSCESSTSSDQSTSGSPDSGVSGTSSNSQESSQTTSSGASTTVQEESGTSSTTGDVSQDASSTTVADRRSTTAGDEDFSSTTTNDRQSTTSADASRSSTGTSTRSTSDGGSSENIECTEEGFFRHPEDCSKFYRCVDFAGTGESFVRYDFDCPEGLVFDEVNSVCNWPNQSPACESGSTRRGSDATSSDENVPKTTTEGIDSTRDGTSTSESSFSSSGTDSSRESTFTSEDSVSSSGTYKTTESATSGTSSGTTSAGDFQCEEEGFFKNPNDCKKYYECKRDEESGELIKIDCECPEGHVFDSEGWYCNAEELSPPCDEDSFRCTEEGFFRDPEDCTKYYQCNKTGPGNDDFRSEKFQCPDGYVFDENGRYCNAPELSEPCDEASGSTRITKSDESVSSTTSATTSSSASSTSSSVSKGECTEEGFFRNPEDCTKYYQCSRNEDTGEIERTDFTCPDGRVFDEGPSYCNDPQLSEEPCESGSTSTTRKQTNAGNADSSTSTAAQTPGSTSSTEGSQADSRRSGGGPQCTQEGFFRHPDDCNKFYRCVDFSGSGESFVRYDFDCPEGLHFDEVNSVCNWPTMTPACKSESSSFL